MLALNVETDGFSSFAGPFATIFDEQRQISPPTIEFEIDLESSSSMLSLHPKTGFLVTDVIPLT